MSRPRQKHVLTDFSVGSHMAFPLGYLPVYKENRVFREL